MPVAIASAELNIVLSILLLLFVMMNFRHGYSRQLISTVLPLGIIVFIASIMAFFYSSEPYDRLKDFLFLLKPALFIVLGYYFTSKCSDKQFIFKAIIYLAVFFAIWHIFQVFSWLATHRFGITLIRNNFGKANYIELFALVLLFIREKDRPFHISKQLIKVAKWILYVSFVLYFSRTMLVTLFVMLLAVYGYTKLTRKGIIYISIILSAVVLFFVALQSMDIERGGVGLEGFLYKIKNAPAEIFTSNVDVDNRAYLWDHWRGYEARMAFDQLAEVPGGAGFIFGKGIGALVDLQFVAPLNREGIRYIPTLHNGFVYIMYKSGIIGLLFYFLFLLYTYMQTYKLTPDPKMQLVNNLISGIAIYFFFTTLIITGPYNHGDVITLILGALLYVAHHNKNKPIEA